MDVSVKLIEKNCGRYLKSYGNCVDRFPETWHLDCDRQKTKLAKCAESNPTILKIKYECIKPYREYEECINKCPLESHKCNAQYNAFCECADYVVNNDKQNKTSGGTDTGNKDAKGAS